MSERQTKLTVAVAAALEVAAVHHPRACRRTSYATDVDERHLYWQAADRLVELGYAVRADGASGQYVRLTDAGVERAKAEGFRFDPEPQPVDPEAGVFDVLARQMNESLSEHLAELAPSLRSLVFAHAEGILFADAVAGKQVDLLRAFTEALLEHEPRYRHPPAPPPDQLTLPTADPPERR